MVSISSFFIFFKVIFLIFNIYLSLSHLIIQDDHDRPTPKPLKKIKSFFLIIFFLSASLSAKGIVEETVFPIFFKFV